MRYILLFSDGSIHVGARDEESSYIVWAKKGWRSGVADLAALVKRRAHEGKITALEIQSHGDAGRIIVNRVDGSGDITNDNVHAFAALLRPIMARGGLIEILACKVAAIGASTPEPAKGANQYPADVRDEYFGGMLKNPVLLRPVGDHYDVVPLDGALLQRHQQNVANASASYLGLSENGLEFCLTLARGTGAIVRASSLSQAEEFSDYRDEYGMRRSHHAIMRDFDRFGDWEGNVWDFMPNGQVKYLGCNLPRQRVRFPTHQVGPQLTCNFREQGGNDSDVGLRPQRMNRAPLPV